MKSRDEFTKTAQDKQQWAATDPVTLVSAARESVHEIPENRRDELSGPIDEVISRFEQQSRAALGTGQAALAYVGGGQGSSR